MSTNLAGFIRFSNISASVLSRRSRSLPLNLWAVSTMSSIGYPKEAIQSTLTRFGSCVSEFRHAKCSTEPQKDAVLLITTAA